jgi:DNA-binding LacI/PurR family transcriptional regulator
MMTAEEHGPSPRPTIETVAKAAAVSRQTVSNVVNAPHRVRESTRLRVEQVIAEIGYRPLKVAQFLRTRRSDLIGVGMRTRDGSSPVLDAFFHSLTAQTQRRGYRIMLATSEDDASEIHAYDDLLADYNVDAVVLTGTHLADERIPWLTRRGVPFVTFGRPWGEEAAHAWVDVDGRTGTRRATEHLLDSGYRRVAFIGWPDGSGVGDDRRSGWELACRSRRVAFRGLLRKVIEGVDPGRAATRSLLDSDNPPTAIVCVSDAIALGAWVEVTARNLHPGRDIAIIGFDDSPTAAVVGLTSVAQPLEAAAEATVDLLQELLAERGAGQHLPARQVLLEPELVFRASG